MDSTRIILWYHFDLSPLLLQCWIPKRGNWGVEGWPFLKQDRVARIICRSWRRLSRSVSSCGPEDGGRNPPMYSGGGVREPIIGCWFQLYRSVQSPAAAAARILKPWVTKLVRGSPSPYKAVYHRKCCASNLFVFYLFHYFIYQELTPMYIQIFGIFYAFPSLSILSTYILYFTI